MNNFNKTYKNLAKIYNLNPNDLYLEYKFGDGLKWAGKKISSGAKAIGDTIGDGFQKIWNIIKKGPAALLNLVKDWFSSSKDEKSAKENAEAATKLINLGSDKKIVSESNMLIPKWFSSLCNTVKHSISFLSSDKEKQAYGDYLKNNCKLTAEKWHNMSFSDKRDNFSKFANKELEEKNIVSEEIFKKELINENIENKTIITESILATCVGFLVVIIIAVIIFKYVDNNIFPMTAQGEANKAVNDAEAEAEKDKKLQQIELDQMIAAFKDCEALK